MTDDHPVPDLITRRALLSTLGLTAGAGALLGALPGGTTAGAAPGAGLPDALGGNVAALTYLQLDALAFFTALTGGTNGRYSDDTSGTGAIQSGQPLSAALVIPVGSVVRQLNFSYQGAPSVFIYRRPLVNPQTEQAYVNVTLAAGGGGPQTQTVTDGLPLTIEADNTYSLRLNVAPGESIYGVTVGYQPPTQGFVPFAGTNPRVYDSRPIGKLTDGEERTIPLGLAGARGAVVNLTLTRTVGNSGYVAVFAAGVTWPGNSSQNWYAAGANVANCVITAVDTQGRIVVRGGENPTDVIVDVIGYLY